LRDRLDELGVRVWTGRGYEGKPDARALVRFTRALSRLLAAERPDVVWATGQKAAVLCAAACRARGVPLVWHKVDFSREGVIAKPLGAAVNGVVSVSEAAAAGLGPLHRLRVLGVVGPPIRLGEEVAAHPDPARPVVGTLGRLVPYKGQHHIVRAASLLAGEFPGLRVVLAGEPDPNFPGYRDSLHALVAELGLAEVVQLPGHVGDVPGLLAEMTVYVNATYRDESGFGFEGLSGAMLEAAWAGVPVVAARGGGTAEGVVDGETGTLVDGPEPELLAPALAAYLRDPSLVQRTGAAARAFARERFAPGPAAERLFGLLERAAGGDRRS
jgi:hypothetical protein